METGIRIDMAFKIGDTAYIIESNRYIKEGVIASCSGGVYLFKYREGGIRVKKHRLYATKEEAEQEIRKYRPEQKYY